jgi:two-component system nitrogen regulation response regulator NtrX
MRQLREQVAMAAPTNGRVLIYGENGTGKELVARTIYGLSRRRTNAFVEVNCAAIPEELIESELFGHVKGSFTGAVNDRRGKFELADGGTLFLDEIGDMSLKTQAKVLRVLQEQTVERVGGSASLRVDVRVLAATNKELPSEIRAGRFREDLYFRLNVIPIFVPPLRDRDQDVPLLANHFMAELASEYGRRAKRFDAGAMVGLLAYKWPGNVRELRNAIERAMLLTDREWLEPGDFTTLTRVVEPTQFRLPPEGVNLEEVERQLLTQALERAGGNQSQAAQLLGINRDQVRYRIEKFGLKA